MVYNLRNIQRVPLGHQGENLAHVVVVDVTEWLAKWPAARIELVVIRPHEDTAYIPETFVVNGLLTWPVTAADVGLSGTGRAELRALSDDVVVKSKVFDTVISPCLDGTVGEPPAAGTDWVNDVLDAATRAEEAAKQAESNTVGYDVVVRAVESYMSEHPVVVEETDPTVPAWAKQPNKPTYTADEVGAAEKVKTEQALDSLSSEIAGLKDAGVGEPGGDGEDGGYYTPSVTEAGVLSWAASKAGMPNVASVSIKGPAGKDGKDGDPGPAGAPGVHYGDNEPSDPNVKVWINPDGEATIPGGAASEGVEELIARITTNGEADAFVIDKMPNGDPMNLDAAYIDIDASVGGNASVYIVYYCGDKEIVSNTPSTSESSAYTGSEIEKKNGRWHVYQLASGSIGRYGVTYKVRPFYAGEFNSEITHAITKIWFRNNNKNIGTVITVRGVQGNA